ncbi:MAG: 2Fe-2S iron-sulfur cluster binding domain-containing protein [Anaerolineales bacterium]|nr:2Fe-2S iron-sulfur cluster binding domain-containing protein [Anaerolineales bacterium]
MAFSIREAFYWLQDVVEYVHVLTEREVLRRSNRGVDYTADEYKNQVRRVVSRIHPNRMQLKLAEIHTETISAKTFRFVRLDGPIPPFRPGQYVNLFVEVDGVQTSRPYSISSIPEDETIDLTVQEKPGGFVSTYLLRDLQPGDELESTGPSGRFYHEPLMDGTKLVFLAGGSGITPFRSIIRFALHRELPLEMHLLYGSRLAGEVIYHDELQELADSNENFQFSLVISEPADDYDGLTGFLDGDLIRKQVGNVEDKTFFLCGPNEMYDFCLEALQGIGVPQHKIHREVYGPPADVTLEPGWPPELAGDMVFEIDVDRMKSIRAPAGEPLMNSMERHGIVVPARCRSGTCGACRIKVISGKVYMPPSVGLRESDEDHGYTHACVCYPLENLEIRL